MNTILLRSTLAAIVLAAGLATPGSATIMRSDVAAQAGDTDVSAARRGGGRAGAARVHRAGAARVNRAGTARVHRAGTARVHRGAAVNVNRRANVNVHRRTNVNVNRRTNVNIRRPVRVWAPRPYYGTIVGGIALGTIVAATAAGAVPAAPGPNMCWFWTDSSQVRGYWDYCQAP